MKKIADLGLNSINGIKEFVNIAQTTTADIYLVSGKYVIDAKSIMGIFSLDLMKPVALYADASASDAEVAAVKEAVKDFVVE